MAQTQSPAVGCESDVKLEGNYFVSAYPPFSCWEKDGLDFLPALLDKPGFSPGAIPLGLYVHIPFCSVRCLYCYYLSYASVSSESMDNYIDHLIRELRLYGRFKGLSGRKLDFAYLGGGTPSLLAPKQIERLLVGLKEIFPWDSIEEVTFECSPKSISREKLEVLDAAGVTRVSMGVQQLDDAILRQNGREHLVSDIEEAYSQIRKFDFPVVNLDLMVGMLGEQERSLMQSVERLIEWQPASITIYQLEMPQYTPLYRLYRDKRLEDDPVPWETKRARLAQAFAYLNECGYQLRSAYTAVRSEEHRPFIYQDAQYRGADLIGLGASSFSYYSGTHYQNLTDIDSYLRNVHEDLLPVARAYKLNREEQLIREFVLQLKLGGVSRQAFLDKFGVDIYERFNKPVAVFEEEGLLQRSEHELTVTRAGLLKVDHVLSAFYLPKHQGLRYS